jgi:hypothetical protein
MVLILKYTSRVLAFALLFGIPVASAGVLDPDAGPAAPVPDTLVNTIGVRLALVRSESPGCRPFYISQQNVTFGHWYMVMGKWGSGNYNEPTSPATGLSRSTVKAFCKRLSGIEGREYRLASAAEMELAGRAPSALDETAAGFHIVCDASVMAGGAQVYGLYDEGPRVVSIPPPPPFPYHAVEFYEFFEDTSSLASVEVVVGKDGRPLSAKAVAGTKLLRPTAADYVMQWRFEPATTAGRPVAAKSVVVVNWNRVIRGHFRSRSSKNPSGLPYIPTLRNLNHGMPR